MVETLVAVGGVEVVTAASKEGEGQRSWHEVSFPSLPLPHAHRCMSWQWWQWDSQYLLPTCHWTEAAPNTPQTTTRLPHTAPDNTHSVGGREGGREGGKRGAEEREKEGGNKGGEKEEGRERIGEEDGEHSPKVASLSDTTHTG